MTGPLGTPPGMDAAATLGSPHLDADRFLEILHERHRATRSIDVGYPVATDIDYCRVEALADGIWNNIGDPYTDPPGGNHTKPAERALLEWAGELFGFPAVDRWGYVTTGGTEGNHAALHAARNAFPVDARGHTTAVGYYSAAAHYSVPKIFEFLSIPAFRVRAAASGEMDYDHLAQLLALHPTRPAIVNATVGTTMTEAIDDVDRIAGLLPAMGVRHSYLHVDAALTGIPLALDGALQLDRADSVAISGYKFFGTQRICGLVLGRRHTRRQGRHIAYTATADTTLTGSRDGLGALQMWYAVAVLGDDGHRARTAAARDLATYATKRLTESGWPAWRHPWAMTVVFATPPPAVTGKWKLASADGVSHFMCMPGRTHWQVDAFVADVVSAAREASAPGGCLPRQRINAGPVPLLQPAPAIATAGSAP
jgi:histidine decarboxylase